MDHIQSGEHPREEVTIVQPLVQVVPRPSDQPLLTLWRGLVVVEARTPRLVREDAPRPREEPEAHVQRGARPEKSIQINC